MPWCYGCCSCLLDISAIAKVSRKLNQWQQQQFVVLYIYIFVTVANRVNFPGI